VDPHVGQVVAAEVRDARDHPALEERQAHDVRGHHHRQGHQPTEVRDQALCTGPPDVVLDHLVHGALDVAVLLLQLRLGGQGGRR